MYLNQGSDQPKSWRTDPPLGNEVEIEWAIRRERYYRRRAKRERYEGVTKQRAHRAALDLVVDAIIAMGLLAGIVVSLVYYPELIPASLFGSGLVALLRILTRRRKLAKLVSEGRAPEPQN